MAQIHRVLPLVNPSFEQFRCQMPDQSWSTVNLFSGRTVPVGWTIGSDGPPPYTDAERFTRKSEFGVKVCMGAGSQRTWMMQTVSGLTPGLEYGFGGWVMRREFGNENPAADERSKVGMCLSLTAVQEYTGIAVEWLADTRNTWSWFGKMFIAPASGTVSLWLVMENIFLANNVFYWDHVDDPEWIGG